MTTILELFMVGLLIAISPLVFLTLVYLVSKVWAYGSAAGRYRFEQTKLNKEREDESGSRQKVRRG